MALYSRLIINGTTYSDHRKIRMRDTISYGASTINIKQAELNGLGMCQNTGKERDLDTLLKIVRV